MSSAVWSSTGHHAEDVVERVVLRHVAALAADHQPSSASAVVRSLCGGIGIGVAGADDRVVALDERRRLVGHALGQVPRVVDVVEPDAPDLARTPVRRGEPDGAGGDERASSAASGGPDQLVVAAVLEDGHHVGGTSSVSASTAGRRRGRGSTTTGSVGAAVDRWSRGSWMPFAWCADRQYAATMPPSQRTCSPVTYAAAARPGTSPRRRTPPVRRTDRWGSLPRTRRGPPRRPCRCARPPRRPAEATRSVSMRPGSTMFTVTPSRGDRPPAS